MLGAGVETFPAGTGGVAMAQSNPQTILHMAILLLVVVGLCLAIAFRLLKAPPRRNHARKSPVPQSLSNASPAAAAQPRRAGAVERMDAEIAAESGAEWKRPRAARTARPDTTPRTDLKAMDQAALEVARRMAGQPGGGGTAEPDPARMAAYWSSEAIQAAKVDQYEAASYASDKATLYKRLARQAAKAAGAARRAKRMAETPVANRKKD